MNAPIPRPMEQAASWPREAFLSNEISAAGPCPEVIDVTGRARYLVFGPYRILAPGLWRARVRLRLCPDAARSRLAAQFGAEPHYSSVDLDFGVAGYHEVEVRHRFEGDAGAQVRLWLKKAAFHGEVLFMGAEVDRIVPEGAALPGSSGA